MCAKGASMCAELASMCDNANEEPVIMRCVFQDGTTDSLVRKLIESYAFDTLRNYNSLTKDEQGLRVLFQREDDEAALDGGLRFDVVYEKDGRGPFLDIARVNDGRDGLPAVIREKQVCRKVVAHLERYEAFSSSRIRAFGSGSF